MNLHGTFATLVTPMYRGSFDAESMRKLVKHLDPKVDGFIPCASTGEGDKLTDDEWAQVVSCVSGVTRKNVIAGIKSTDYARIISRAKIAHESGCAAILLPVTTPDKVIEHVRTLASAIPLPIVVYNTEDANAITTIEVIQQLDKIPGIAGIKDSSMDIEFFQQMIDAKKKGDLQLSLFQGMECLVADSAGCDGSLTAFATLEPELCRQATENPNDQVRQQMNEMFWTHNLGGTWYAAIKAILFARGLIRSAEEVRPAIEPK